MQTETIKRSGKNEREHLPAARVVRSRRSLFIWLIPVGALCICGWFVYRDYIGSGPAITIFFENAEGLEAKNTQIKYRGAEVGEVNYIGLSRSGRHVEVRARLHSSAANLARAGSVFWIVRPELRVGGVTGLRTIISGEYITVRPGNGAATNRFIGAANEPVTEQTNALQITLLTTNLGSVEEQTPIFYRGIEVGHVLYYQLTPDSRQVLVHAEIRPEYAPLVRPETKFWNVGGISVHGGLFKGLQISAASPSTILTGGVEFATPPGSQAVATNGTEFELNEKPDDKWKAWSPEISLRLPQQATQSNTPPDLNPPWSTGEKQH